MKISLDTPNPEMDPALLDAIGVNNTKKIRQAINATGVSILLETSFMNARTVTSVTDEILQGFDKVFTSSGGMVDIVFQSGCDMSGGVYGFVTLWVDDVAVLITTIGGASQQRYPLSMYYSKKLSAGRHKMKITAKVTGGTFTYSFISQATTILTIKETVV